MTQPQFSIIIPTYNHCWDLLHPCLQTVIAHTDLTEGEIIVVANGCVDQTREVVTGFNLPQIRLLWYDNALGFAGAVNEGIRASTARYVVLLNNDVVLQPQQHHHWMQRLLAPFANPFVGITGPLLANGHQSPTRRDFVVGFCAAIRREVIEQIGLLDESFGVGGAEDIDYCIRAENVGWQLEQISNWQPGMHYIDYPMAHKVNGTMSEVEGWNDIFFGNLARLHDKYQAQERPFAQFEEPLVKYSIVIPTYNHLEDALKPCIDSLLTYTTFENTELVVVCNGCTDGTEQYLKAIKQQLGPRLNVLWNPEPMGYTRANNWGIRQARGEYIILLNNDTAILPSGVNDWITTLHHPFTVDEQVGMTGPMKAYCPYSDEDFLIFFCVMVPRRMFDLLGLPDEIYSPGFGEDTDFSIRVKQAGYKLVQVPSEDRLYYAPDRMVGGFPIWHAGEITFGDTPDGLQLLRRNRLILAQKFQGGKGKLKLNLGCGDKLMPGYMNIDLYHEGADFQMDVRKLDFPDSSVSEIYGSHIFEHISPFDIHATLEEWRRVLRQGGKLVLEMPDMLETCRQFVSASKDERYKLLNCIYGTGNGTQSPHLFGWYDEILRDHLGSHGFANIQVAPATSQHWGYNLVVTATRDDLPQGYFGDSDIQDYRYFVSKIPQGGTLVEIGTFRGRSLCSVADLIQSQQLKVFAIDTFEGSSLINVNEHELKAQCDSENIEQQFRDNIQRFGISDRVTLLKGPNHSFVDQFEDHSVDLVFLDADHSYEAVKQDIALWRNKVKVGGHLSGHDIDWYSVRTAVVEAFGNGFARGTNTWATQIQHSTVSVTPTQPRIFDCFPFNDELDVLELRLHEMSHIVDKFIIVEGTRNFANQPKPLYYGNNKSRFAQWQHQIIHVVVDDWPTYHDSWTYERYQRDQIDRGLAQCDCQDHDIVIITDADEIPRAQAVQTYSTQQGILNLEQTLYYYNFNCRSQGKWLWGKILPHALKKHMTCCHVRYYHDGVVHAPQLANAGWHCSYFGDAAAAIRKLESGAHQEYNTPLFKQQELIAQRMACCEDLLGRNIQYEHVTVDGSYPQFVQLNLDYYKSKALVYESNSL